MNLKHAASVSARVGSFHEMVMTLAFLTANRGCNSLRICRLQTIDTVCSALKGDREPDILQSPEAKQPTRVNSALTARQAACTTTPWRRNSQRRHTNAEEARCKGGAQKEREAALPQPPGRSAARFFNHARLQHPAVQPKQPVTNLPGTSIHRFVRWTVRGASPHMPHTTTHGDGGACPGSSSLAEQEHTRLQGEASTPYDAADGAHLLSLLL